MDEKSRILKMVAEGTVTPEQAEQLLDALGADVAPQSPAVPASDYDRKMFRIQINSADGEMMDAVAECLDSRVIGDFVTVESADGDHVRFFVE